MRTAVLIVLLAVSSVNAGWAEPWRLVTESSGNRVYVDAGSVRPDGVYLTFAGRTIFQNGDELLDGYSARCEVRLVGMHSSFRFDSRGNNTSGFSVQPHEIRFFPVGTDTPLAAQLEYVCSGRAISERNSADSISGEQSNRNALNKDDPEKAKSNAPAKTSTVSASGVIVGVRGEILTNHHVIDGCLNIAIKSEQGAFAAQVVAADPRLDVALLRGGQSFKSAIPFRSGPPAAPRETVIALGYPYSGLLASEVNVSVGVISALAGIGNDVTQLQISAPVQPGSSGGPLLDSAGNLVGLVVSKLNALRVAKITGDIPQNINFAIKVDAIRIFLDANQVAVKSAVSTIKQDASIAASRGRPFTVRVTCN
jgi:S1-C subfamily serine protease